MGKKKVLGSKDMIEVSSAEHLEDKGEEMYRKFNENWQEN